MKIKSHKANSQHAQIVPLAAASPADSSLENYEEEEETCIDQQWIDLIEKEDKYWDTCRGREQCTKLLLSRSCETITNDVRFILWEKFINLNEKVAELPPNCFNLFLEKKCERWNHHGIEENGDTIYMHDNISQILLDVPRSTLGIGDTDTRDEKLKMISRTHLFNVLYALSMYYPQVCDLIVCFLSLVNSW
jgi:hypothetical protein